MQLGSCIHFRSTHHFRTCKAGVYWHDVRTDRPDKPYGWPCRVKQFGGGERPDSCAHYCGATAEDVARSRAEADAAVNAALAGLCPECGTKCKRHEDSEVVILTCPTHGGVMRACKRIEESYYESESQ